MFDFQKILRDNITKIGAVITAEHGKPAADAKGDIIRGLEIVEHACGISHV